MAPDGSRWPQESPLLGLSARQLPSNAAAEQALLGGILANNRALEAVPRLAPEHFSDPVHGAIYQAILEQTSGGAIADCITLRPKLEHSGVMVPVGGVGYLAQLLTAMVTPKYIEPYGAAIIDAWQRRQIIAAAEAMVNNAFDGDMVPAEGAARAIAAVDVALDNGTGDHPASMAVEAFDAAVAGAEAAFRAGGPTGLSTGMKSVDAVTGGMGGGEMIVLAARPGMGKSALAVQWAKSAARQCADSMAAGGERRGVLMLSLEMSATQLGRRIIAEEANVPLAALKAGRHNSYASQIVVARRRVADLPLLIEDLPGQTVKQLHLKARGAQRRFGKLALIVVDHLHIVRPEGADAKNGGTWAVGQISNALKRMAKEFNCPVLALAQLSRGVEGRDDKRPTLADLRYSGEIEQDADAIAFLYREEYYLGKGDPARKTGESQQQYADRCLTIDGQRERAKGGAELIFAKVRDGEPTTLPLRFDGPRTCFSEPITDDDDRQGRWV